jgi:STE24 endopeptidase
VVVSLAAPVLPYLTGTWELAWYRLAATDWPVALRAAVFLFGVHVVLALVALPLAYYGGYVLPRVFDLGRQTVRAWTADWIKGALLGAGLGTLVAGLFLWSVVATGSHWWWTFGAAATLLGLLLVFAMPYVLVPLFFSMRPLEDPATVARIQALVTRAGAPVRDICTLDFSRRTAEANAAVMGFGRSRRVVLADTLLAEFPPAEVDAVVAHELGHHVHRDVQLLLLGNAVLVWVGLFAASRLVAPALPVLSVPSLAYLPAYPVLLAIAEFYFLLVAPLLNWWSRRLESRADRFALEVTRDPNAFAAAMSRLGTQNLVELWPPRWAEVLLATHPALGRRIASARAWSA